jgi:hypothetical protein
MLCQRPPRSRPLARTSSRFHALGRWREGSLIRIRVSAHPELEGSMRVADGESKLGEYYFKGVGDVANMSAVTDRRLVITYGNAEESYPLSKITSVRVIYYRSWKMMLGGAVITFIGLTALASNVVGGLVCIIIGGALIFFGWKGKTQLEIGQMGGNKIYPIRGQDPLLMEFMHTVNSRLS